VRARACVLVLAVALAAHARSLGGGFVYDDAKAILENPVVTGPFDPTAFVRRDFWGLEPGAGVASWRPLPVLTFWVDWRTGGGGPFTFHLTNLVLHALAALALAWAARSTLAGVLLATLAVCTEAVAGIVGRADVMAAGLCFLAWGLSRRSGPAAAAAWLLALLCKESAIVFPVWLVLIEGPRRSQLWLAAGLAAYVALRGAAYGLVVEDTFLARENNVLLTEPLGVRLLTALRLFLLALRLTLLPVSLSADYAFAEILPERGLSVEVAAGATALAGLVALALVARRRAPDVSRGIAIFLAGFAVVSNVALILPAIFAERLLYLPAAGAALALAAGLRLARPRALALGLGVLLAGGNLARSVVRDGDWRDDLTLFAAAAEASPRSARAHYNHGAALRRAGRPEEAAAALALAIEIAPAWAKPRSAAGAALDELGEPALAEVQLRRAVELDADDAEATFNYGLFLARRGRPAEAVAVLERFAARHPQAANVRRLLNDIRSR
jgi:tetratricopeptide (TPR) repeat protein